jgi:hypothetical protein
VGKNYPLYSGLLITIKVTEKIHVFKGKNRKKYGVFLGGI